VRLIKERSALDVQASGKLGVHKSLLRNWMKKFGDDPQYAFPG
jgi:hypothetical protein